MSHIYREGSGVTAEVVWLARTEVLMRGGGPRGEQRYVFWLVLEVFGILWLEL